jgi:hypothetical protein
MCGRNCLGSGIVERKLFGDMGITNGHIALKLLKFAKTVDFSDIGFVVFPFE